MKKYKLEDLKVAKINYLGEMRYVICTRSKLFNVFTDAITGDKIEPLFPVEPLSKYYRLEEKYDFRTNRYIKLTKRDILHKYQEINELKKKESEEITKRKEQSAPKQEDVKLPTPSEEKEIVRSIMSQEEIDAEEILESALKDFFPTTGDWWSSCFDRPTTLYMSNMPCNLRDDEWMAQMFQKQKNLYNFVNYYDILFFVRNSQVYKEARHNYELEIVKWQIQFIKDGGSGWICDDKYGGDAMMFTGVCDLGFRKGVLDTLTAIGMNREVIEEGLEKYAYMWRDNYMSRAFSNDYEPFFYLADPNAYLEPIDEEHKSKWIRYRKYEYYKRHKEIVDKYGEPDADMLISDREAFELRQYLEVKDKERKYQIEEYKKEAYGNPRRLI